MTALQRYERHPLSAAWPNMAREDFDALVTSIERNGLREPVVVFDGMILDGWHRMQACESAARPMSIVIFDGDAAAAEQFVCDKHTRRSLTATQRATAVLAMMQWRTRKDNASNFDQSVPNTDWSKSTAKDIAVRAGVSVATVEKVKTANVKAPDRAQDMRDGKVSASTVLRDVEQAKKNPVPDTELNLEPAEANDDEDDDDYIRERYLDLVNITNADDKLGAAVKKLEIAQKELTIAKRQIIGLMNEKNAATRAAVSWEKKYRALKKQGEGVNF
jgi:hypothetical protein